LEGDDGGLLEVAAMGVVSNIHCITLFVLCYFKDEPFVYVSSEWCLLHFKRICILAVQFLQTLSIHRVSPVSIVHSNWNAHNGTDYETFVLHDFVWKGYLCEKCTSCTDWQQNKTGMLQTISHCS